jgi:hypothetical protein
MLKPAGLRCALALAVAASPPLSAQGLADVCQAVATAHVGQWASFDATGGSFGEGRLRLAIVGSERSGDSTLYWVEINFTAKDPTHSVIVQILTPGLAASPAGRTVILKAGDRMAMKIPGAMAGMMGQAAGRPHGATDWAARCSAAHVVGWESVTVPAGTFHALHLTTDEGGEAWASPDIPFGMVKMHGRDGDMVLTGRGSDAMSSITEKPQEMPLLPGMMQKP